MVEHFKEFFPTFFLVGYDFEGNACEIVIAPTDKDADAVYTAVQRAMENWQGLPADDTPEDEDEEFDEEDTEEDEF